MNSEQPRSFRGQSAAGEAGVNVLLWNRVRENGQDALVDLYEQLYFHLVSYGVRNCGDTEITKDAINDMFLEIWDQRHKLPEVSNVKSYLPARNVAKNYMCNIVPVAMVQQERDNGGMIKSLIPIRHYGAGMAISPVPVCTG
jgi:hypothetical protein